MTAGIQLFLALLLTNLISLQALSQTVFLDARGADGRNAPHGIDGGQQEPGTDAGFSTPGKDGGLIDVTLRDLNAGEAAPLLVHIFGSVGTTRFDQIVTYQQNSKVNVIKLDASGGRGGDGGRGGNGGPGLAGRSGTDATKGSSGTNGTDGTSGADAGNGSPASDGGDGGPIRVRLDAKDAHLAILVNYKTEGGSGGYAGVHGKGGSGGPGGSGGDDYSEDETVELSPDCSGTEERVISNGDGSFSTTSSPKCIPRSQTIYHRQAGGKDGEPGPKGNDGTGDISAGKSGLPGAFEFIVTEEDGSTQRYTSVYDLHLESYDYVDENRDGVFRPGEKVIVSNIVVRNSGHMPSPYGNSKALVTLRLGDWFVANPLELEIPSVPGKASLPISGTLEFTIKENTIISSNKPFEILDSVTPVSYLTRVNKTFAGFELPKTVRISYPIEISPLVSSRRAVGPGESVEIFWKVTNVSSKDFGVQNEVDSSITTKLFGVTAEQGAQVSFIADSGGLKSGTVASQLSGPLSSAFEQSISTLAAGDSLVIAGELKFNEDLEAYTTVSLAQSLAIKNLTNSGLQTIQQNTFQFTISQIYRQTADADFLLVLNDQTSREEYLAWTELGKRLGLKFDIWDISYHGFLSLSRIIADAEKALFEAYAGKTIVLVNTQQADRTRPQDLLELREFFLAAKNYNTNLVILGGTGLLEATLKSQPERGRLSLDQGHIVALDIGDQMIHQPKFVAGYENTMALVLALPLALKLKMLTNTDLAGNATQILNNAILHDLVLAADSPSDEFFAATLETAIQTALGLPAGNTQTVLHMTLIAAEFYLNQTKSSGFLGLNKDQQKNARLRLLQRQMSALQIDVTLIKSHQQHLKKILDTRTRRLVGLSKQESLLRMLTWPAVHNLDSSEQLFFGTTMKGKP